MIDGHAVNNRIFGSLSYIIGSIPVESVERIEIIRGPGSVMYGTNAFHAVINVITIRNSEGSESRSIAKIGSDKTIAGVTTAKIKEGDFQLSATGSYLYSDGPQLDFTDINGLHGKTDFEKKIPHLYVNLQKGMFGFSGLYNQETLGPFVGLAYQLNDETERDYTTMAAEGRFNTSFFDEKYELSGKAYWDMFKYDCFWEIISESESNPYGYIAEGKADDFRVGTEWNLQIRFSDRHRLLSGFVYDYIELSSSSGVDNSQDPSQMTSESEWISTGNEKNYAFYLQDNLFITDTLQIVAGLRYDNHTAYGDSWNPRCALTKKLGDKTNIKILYGQAFRSPTFWELYSTSDDQLGNPNLEPEKIQTFETEVNTFFNKYLFGRINYYHNEIRDIILTDVDNIPKTMKNMGKTVVDGVEAELRGNLFNENHSFTINGFFNKSEDKYLDKDVYWVPQYGIGYIQNNRWSKYINTNIHVKYIGKIEREESDTRSDISAVTLVDFSARLSNLMPGVSLAGSLYNLFDKEQYSPSPSFLQEDFPHSGRTFLVTVEYSY